MFNPSTLGKKQGTLANTASNKQANVANQTPQKQATLNESTFDYGSIDFAAERQRTSDAVQVQDGRDAGGIFGDAAVSLGQGVTAVAKGVYGFADAGTYGGLEDVTGAGTGLNRLDEYLEGYRSEVGKKQHEAYQTREDLEEALSDTQLQEDLANGQSPFIATAKKEGRDAFDTAKNLLTTPSVLFDETVKQVPQLAGAGLTGKLFKKVLVDDIKDATSDQAKEQAVKEIAAGTAGGNVYTGVSEGGSAGLDAKATILKADQDVLYDNSKEYRRLVDEEGYSRARAQDILSKDEQASTALIVGIVSAGLSLVTGAGKFSGNLDTKGSGIFKTKLKDVGSETIEEASQGLTGEVQQNRVTKANIDPTISLIKDTGKAVGKGAVLGATSSVAIGPSLAAAKLSGAVAKATGKGAIQVTKAAPGAIRNTGSAVKKLPTTIKATKTKAKEAVASAKAVETAIKTGDVTKITNPLDKLEVALDKTNAPKTDTTPEERTTYNESLLDIADELVAERSKVVEKYGNKLPKKAAAEVSKLSAGIDKIAGIVIANQAEDPTRETSDSLSKDISKVKQATERTTEAEEVIFRSSKAMDSQRDTVSESTAQAIVDSPITSDNEKQRAKLFIATKQAELVAEVGEDIKYGNKQGDIGYTQYQSQIATAIERGRDGTAKSALEGLRTFKEGHAARTQLIEDTFEAYKKDPTSPETLALIESTRKATINRKTGKGFVVSSGTGTPLAAMKAEDAALSAALAESQFVYDNKFVSQKAEKVTSKETNQEADVTPAPVTTVDVTDKAKQTVTKDVTNVTDTIRKSIPVVDREAFDSKVTQLVDRFITQLTKGGAPTKVKANMDQVAIGIRAALAGKVDSITKPNQYHKAGIQVVKSIGLGGRLASPKTLKYNFVDSQATIPITEEFSLPSQVLSDKIVIGGNTINDFMVPTPKDGSILQTVPNVRLVIRDAIQGKTDNLPDQLRDLNAEQQAALPNLLRFMVAFNTTFNKQVFVAKKFNHFKAENAVEFLTNSKGEFDAGVVDAMAIVMYEWIATQSGGTIFNTIEGINNLLGFPAEHFLSTAAIDLFSEIGTPATTFVEDIGSKIVSTIGLTGRKDVPGNFKDILEVSLGSAAMATASAMQLLDISFVPNKDMKEHSPAGTVTANTEARTNFVRIRTSSEDKISTITGLEYVGSVHAEKPASIVENIKASDNVLEVLFGFDKTKAGPSYEPQKADAKISSNGQTVTQVAKKAINKLNKVKYGFNRNYKSWSNLSESAQLVIAGFVEDLTTLHREERASTIGTNRGIVRGTQQLKDFREHAEAVGIDEDFYMTYQQTGNTRHQMQDDGITTQGNKDHRAFVAPKANEVEVNENNQDFFKFAVLEAFGKKQDIGLLVNNGTYDKLIADPVIQAGIEAVTVAGLTPSDLTDQHELDIIAAVQEMGEASHSYTALVALSEQALAQGKSFNTSLPLEVDGVTNGIVHLLLQFNSMGGAQQLMEALERGGFFDDGQHLGIVEWMSDPRNKDSYEDIADLTNDHLAKQGDQDTVNKVAHILGKIKEEDGFITAAGRKFAKAPLMTSSYGAALVTIVDNLSSDFIAGIYTKIRKTKNQQELTDLTSMLGIPGMDYDLRNETSLSREDETLLRKDVELTYGDALTDALNVRFGGLHAVMKEMNSATDIMYAVYQLKMEESITQAKLINKGNELSREQMQQIETDNLKYAPTFATRYSESLEESVILGKRERVRNSGVNNKSTLSVKDGLTVTNAVTGKSKTTNTFTSHTSTTQRSHPGVSVGPTGVQTIDASNILAAFDEQILSVHDAIITNINDVSKIGRTLNKDFLVAADYSLPAAILDSLNRIIESLTPAEIIALDKQVGKSSVAFSNDLSDTVTKINNRKAQLLARIKKQGKIDQFGGYDTAYYPTAFVGDLTLDTATELAAVIQERITNNETSSDTLFLGRLSKTINTVILSLETLSYQEALNTLDTKARKEFETFKTYFEDSRNREFRADIETNNKKVVTTDKNIEEVSTLVVQEILDSSPTVTEESNNGEFGSSIDGIDTEAFKAKITETVSADTAQDVFDLLGQQANQGNKEENAEHTQYLGNLITDVKGKILEPLSVMLQDLGDESIGQLSGNNIHINASIAGVVTSSEMSTQEVYVHELVHSLLRPVFDTATWAKSELYSLFDAAAETLTVEDFMPDVIPPGSTEVLERAAAQSRYDHIFHNTDTRTDSSGDVRNNSYHEFFTMALTNQKFRGLLVSKVSLPEIRLFENGMTGVISQLFRKAARLLVQQINGTRDLNAGDSVTQLLNEVIGITNRKNNLISKTIEVIDSSASTALQSMQTYVLAPLNELVQSDFVKNNKSEAVQLIGGALNTFVNSEFADQLKVYRRIASRLGITERNIFGAFIVELVGRTEASGRYHDHLRKIKHTVESLAFKAGESLAQDIKNKFRNPLEQEDQVAISAAAIMTDLSSIHSDYDLPAISELMRDSDFRGQEISKLEATLQAEFGTNFEFYRRNAKSLGHYMARNSYIENGNSMHNAQLIAELAGTSDVMVVEGDVKRAEELINKLATLHSVNFTPAAHRKRFADIVDREHASDPEDNGILFSLNLHNSLKEEALKTNFSGQSRLIVKGYIPELLNPDVTFKVAPENLESELNSQGYVKGDPVLKDPDDPNQDVMFFYINKDGMQNRFQSMAAAHNSNVSKGTDLEDARYQSGVDFATSLARKDFETLVKRKTNNSDNQNRPAGEYTVSNLSPVVDSEGNLVQYRYEMSEATKGTVMEKDYTFTTIMGRMAATIQAKPAAEKGNTELVKMIHDDWKENGSSDANQFITVGLTSTDPKHRELYQLLPEVMRKEILDTFGNNGMQVRKMLIPLILGQRKLSISDLKPVFDPIELANLSASKRMMNGIAKLATTTRLRQVEGITQELVGLAKDAIVIKSGVVLLGNIKSNNWLLWMKGMSGQKIAKYQADAMSALFQYKEDLAEYDRLKHEVMGKTKEGLDRHTQTKMDRLQDKMSTSAIHGLISEGMLQSIVEDVDIEREDAHTYKDKIDRLVAPLTDRVPKGAKDAASQLVMGHDTKLYQFLRATTQASDFIARSALHRHNLEKGMSYADSIADISETFINYELPTHPTIQYANDMGIWMFSKFAVRIQNVILTTIKNSPARVLSLIGIDTMVTDLEYITEQSLLTNAPNIDDTLDNLLGADYAPIVTAVVDKLGDL